MAAPTPVLCPEIAKPAGVVITIDNVDWLKVSTYARNPGTVVQVTCLTAPEYKLHGASTLTCLSSGSWNFAIPVCKPNVVDPSTTVGGDGSDITMVPVLVVCAILAVIFLAFVGVMVFVTCFWKQAGGCRRSPKDLEAVHVLTLQEAESIFTERRLAFYPPSEIGTENLDSISQQCPPQAHAHSSNMVHGDRTAYANGRRGRHSRDFTTTNSLASFDPNPMPIAGGHYFGHRGGEPTEFKTRIGTRQTYRTWQDLFYSPDHY